jgi:outer membrane protein OmpA-like peptidoglycan-associated protein
MLDGFELPLVQAIEGREDEALQEHLVPALEGDFLQDLGRRATRIELNGVLTGAAAAASLKTLRDKHRKASPISFVADIATATKISNVLIEEFGVREIAGRPQRFEFNISLVEYTPAPTPQDVVPPPPPPPPPPPKLSSILEVQVIVDDDPNFDPSKITVTVKNAPDNSTPFSATLTDRTENVWTDDPIPAGSYIASAVAGALSGTASATVPTGQRVRVVIHLRQGSTAATGFVVHYWFDKALIEPCLRQVLRDVLAYAQAHPDEKTLIVGYTDLVGATDYNQALSERRARGVFAYLTAGRAHDASVAEWDALRHSGSAVTRLADNWSVREYQQILSGLSYYAGAIDERHGPLTDAAVRNFQSDHGLQVDGIVGDGTWLALIDAYLSTDALAIPETQFFPNCSGEIVKWLGSDEQDPVRNTQDAWRPNRRTEIVFVKADALPGPVSPPVTFNLPTPGAVNAGWCVGKAGDPVVILSHGSQQPNTFLVQPADPTTITVKGTMVFEDGSPAGGIQYVLTAPDGEYLLTAPDGSFLVGERPRGPDRGRPIPATTRPDGSFTYPNPKPVGVYILSVLGSFTVRLKDSAPNSGTSPILCTKLDGSKDLDVVLAKADGVDPRRKLAATIFDRTFLPRAATAVAIEFPDGSTASATTDVNGQFSVVMADAFKTAKFRYAASDDPNDVVLFQDYFIDVGDIATDDGVSQRLSNLGLLVTDLAAAVTQFQSLTGLAPSGVVDDATRSKLDRVYQGEEPIFVIPTVATSGSVAPLIGDGPPEAHPQLVSDPDAQLPADPF